MVERPAEATRTRAAVRLQSAKVLDDLGEIIRGERAATGYRVTDPTPVR